MPIVYNIGIRAYYLLVLLFSIFNQKAKFWISGRKKWREKYKVKPTTSKVWFHFASLGEFEQGKPLLQYFKNNYPAKEIIITFYSPSGYEVRKNTNLADYILYLPLDTPKNAKEFLDIFKPEIAFFNKYEYWYHFFKETRNQQIPLYITSAIFREKQIFFKFYGKFFREILSYVTRFYVQDQNSAQLLKSIGFNNYTITGDTRFDSVSQIAKNKKDFPEILKFKQENNLFIGGSTWPEDEELIAKFIKSYPSNWKFIFAPHEISENKLAALEGLLNQKSIRYSKIDDHTDIAALKILIIDNIGLLSSLYAYADIAFIGGGFGSGIHNTLEAAAWGLPVIFGPNYQKFDEAKSLIEKKAGFGISNFEELEQVLTNLIKDSGFRKTTGQLAKDFVEQNIGATQKIMQEVYKNKI
jgi:3-deoxy-D-manno-octulosonic-acid transferase